MHYYIGLTHDQLLDLRNTCSELGKQGHSLSAPTKALALLTVNAMVKDLNISNDKAIKVVSHAISTSPSTLRAAERELIQTGKLSEPDNSYRGCGNPDHPLNSNYGLYQIGPYLEAEILIHKLIHTQKTGGKSATSTIISAELNEKLSLSVHHRTVRRWLHELGYRWRHKRYVGGMKPQAKQIRIRQFIIEYAKALMEQKTGNAIIVYMDESYIHTHTANKKGWFHENDCDVIGDNDGKRLIIMHAMTENGLLTVPDAMASNWLNEEALTTELVFDEVLEDGEDDSDYHNTITADKFIAWIRHRLLPTFNQLYPAKQMYLILDNAAYHKSRDETWISAAKSKSKHELAHQLLDLQVTHLTTVSDPTRIIPSHLFSASTADGGPTKDDLVAAVQKWIDEHPDHNKTIVEQLLSDAGHSIIYTPPFCPHVQPIELLWAAIKRYVRERSTLNRSVTETREQTEEAFESINRPFCQNIIKHCHDWIDQFIQSEDSEDLQQCGSLGGVMKHLSLLKLATKEQTKHQPATTTPANNNNSSQSSRSSSSIHTLRKRH